MRGRCSRIRHCCLFYDRGGKQKQMITLQILVAAMRQTDFSLVEKMNLQCDAILANQTDCNACEKHRYPFGNVQMISTDTRGVGVNRNIALEAAEAEYILFADDDVTYADGMPQKVIAEFHSHPDADVLIFGIDYTKNGRVTEQRRPGNKRRHLWNSMRFGAAVTAVKLSAIRSAGIRFNPYFGGGCIYSSGEDTLFLKDCICNGLKVYSTNTVLGRCSKDTSTWFTGCNEKYFYDKGALMNYLFPHFRCLAALYFAIRVKKQTDLNCLKRIQLMMAGVKGGKKLEPYKP